MGEWTDQLDDDSAHPVWGKRERAPHRRICCKFIVRMSCRKSLPALICVFLRHVLIPKRYITLNCIARILDGQRRQHRQRPLGDRAMNSLTWLCTFSPMATANWTKTTGGLSYSPTCTCPAATWCARPVCSMHIARSMCCAHVQCVSDCHIMISVASVMQIIGPAALAGDIKIRLTVHACKYSFCIALHWLAHARPTMPCILLVYNVGRFSCEF